MRSTAWSTGLEGLGSAVGATVDQTYSPVSDQMEQMQTVVVIRCVAVNSPLLQGLMLDSRVLQHGPSFWSSFSSLYYH